MSTDEKERGVRWGYKGGVGVHVEAWEASSSRDACWVGCLGGGVAGAGLWEALHGLSLMRLCHVQCTYPRMCINGCQWGSRPLVGFNDENIDFYHP